MIRVRNDEGVGIITALMVVFIVFSLGAVWLSISSHELDEATVDRHRSAALQASDSGVRRAMAELTRTVRDRLPFWSGTGDTAGICNLESVDSQGVEVGRYWVTVTDLSSPGESRFFVESWGWSGDPLSRQAVVRKSEQEVIIAVENGFVYALFASGGGLYGNNRKEVWGDVYSNPGVTLENTTTIHVNDPGYAGDGNLSVYGDLSISSGSSTLIEGRVRTNGDMVDNKSYGGSIAYEGDVEVGGDAYFKGANIDGDLSIGGVELPGSSVTANDINAPGATVDAVLLEPLPTFDWLLAKTDYLILGRSVFEWATFGDFESWWNSNTSLEYGVHYIADSGAYTLDFKHTNIAEDLVIVSEGQMSVTGAPSPIPGTEPLTISLIANNPATGGLYFSNKFISTDDIRVLAFSAYEFGADNLTTIYGVVYGHTDVSGNQLNVHFRPIRTTIGFTFGIDYRVIAEPLVWREVPAAAITACTVSP